MTIDVLNSGPEIATIERLFLNTTVRSPLTDYLLTIQATLGKQTIESRVNNVIDTMTTDIMAGESENDFVNDTDAFLRSRAGYLNQLGLENSFILPGNSDFVKGQTFNDTFTNDWQPFSKAVMYIEGLKSFGRTLTDQEMVKYKEAIIAMRLGILGQLSETVALGLDGGRVLTLGNPTVSAQHLNGERAVSLPLPKAAIFRTIYSFLSKPSPMGKGFDFEGITTTILNSIEDDYHTESNESVRKMNNIRVQQFLGWLAGLRTDLTNTILEKDKVYNSNSKRVKVDA